MRDAQYGAWSAAYAAEYQRHAQAYGPRREVYSPEFGAHVLTREFLAANDAHMKAWMASNPRPPEHLTDGSVRTFDRPSPFLNGPGGKLMKDPGYA